ncbi:hypothetical protein FE257_002060 [Aspergillus nanangensis]|uniref:Uncharacterized protein n=1 Tax=Aspergillus nanangensis TaxID=2582783 RepID=A0AAD4CTR8_ASPNN|nr:hypothetical protein FE257_002060 [Aspergillus nanangensis]
MSTDCLDATISSQDEFPPRADLRQMLARRPLPVVSPDLVDPISMSRDETMKQARTILSLVNDALSSGDVKALASCFLPTQAYWKDQLALTYHLRTFNTPGVIAAALLETTKLRGLEGRLEADGTAEFVPATPTHGLDIHKEDPQLLILPGRRLDNCQTIDTDVFIIGGGNAAVSLSARLKALGVESVMAERNASPGDNWARRYDCMRFHIPTSACDLPYMGKWNQLRSPHLLSRDELASQVRRYVETFNLNMITSTRIESTQYDPASKLWESVLIVGSANTAFDVIEDTHAAGLETTMVARSPTYVIPVEYLTDKRSLGAHDLGVEETDWLLQTMPTLVDAQLSAGLLTQFASEEPNRYHNLSNAGFSVIDSCHPDAVLFHYLLERAGGHYVDVGGTKLLEDGRVRIKAGVEPVAYTPTGLRFSDNSTIDVDAVVWCTGFADKDIRHTAREILGRHTHTENKNVLTSEDIASRLDATGGVDLEGEIRGMWKRHPRLGDNFWIMGGFTSQHRWHSRTLALQIKAALEGILPPAYRETPTVGI